MNVPEIKREFKIPIPSWIRHFNMSTGLRRKILLLYVCIVVVPILILGTIAGQMVIKSLRSDYRSSVIEAVEQVAQNVEFRKQIYELLVSRISNDGELIARLSENYSDFDTQADTVRYTDRSFRTIPESLPGIIIFRIYHDNATLVEDGGILWKPKDRKLRGKIENEWYQSMIGNASPMKWDTVYEEGYNMSDLTLSRRITFSHNENLGVVYLQLRINEVFGDLIKEPFHGQGEVYLIHSNGYVFASSDDSMSGKQFNGTELNIIPLKDGTNYTTVEINGIKKFAVTRSLSSGWHIVSVLPLANIERQTWRTYFWITAITLSLIVLSTLLVLAVMNNLVSRLSRLENKMWAVAKGKFNVSVARENADELGDLENCFNIMVSQLAELIDEVTLSRTREREEVLKALQAQINPHFLYNTLGIIRWRALDAGDDELCRLVDSMTTFYRLSLNKGNSVLRIRDELEHVRAYIQIQQLRYPDAVNVIWDIDNKLTEYYTIKLILQPVVENSYIHSMIAKKKNGILKISVHREDDNILFEVSDNGIGMSDEVIQNVLKGPSSRKENGYGIHNIRERLNLYFGDRGKLEIYSEPEKGTRVIIKIPVCSQQPVLNALNKSGEGMQC